VAFAALGLVAIGAQRGLPLTVAGFVVLALGLALAVGESL
jgi:hypothetical protein